MTDYLFYTIIHGQPHQMSPGNVERIINKYADTVRDKHPDLPPKVHPHMFRRTRATDLYQSTVDLELVSRILGHASTQTTRIYYGKKKLMTSCTDGSAYLQRYPPEQLSIINASDH